MTAGRSPLPSAALRGVVFDLDGTLIRSVEAVRAALNQVLDRCGLRPLRAEEMPALVGHGAKAMVEQALRLTGGVVDEAGFDSFLDRYRAAYLALPPELTTVFPGAREALATLRGAGIRLGICTNKPHDLAVAALGSARLLDSFSAIIGGDILPIRKPDPEHLFATLRLMAVRPEQAVYVGDNEVDVATANRAGIPIVLVNQEPSGAQPCTGADAIVDGFAELVPALSRLRPIARSA